MLFDLRNRERRPYRSRFRRSIVRQPATLAGPHSGIFGMRDTVNNQ